MPCQVLPSVLKTDRPHDEKAYGQGANPPGDTLTVLVMMLVMMLEALYPCRPCHGTGFARAQPQRAPLGAGRYTK